MDFDTALQHFVNYMHYERNFSAHSIRNYGEDLEMFIKFITPPGETTPSLEATELILLREFVSSLYGRDLSKPTIKRKIAALRAFFKFCVREGWVQSNPAKLLHSPKLPIRVPRVQTPEEISTFLDRMPGGKSRQTTVSGPAALAINRCVASRRERGLSPCSLAPSPPRASAKILGFSAAGNQSAILLRWAKATRKAARLRSGKRRSSAVTI